VIACGGLDFYWWELYEKALHEYAITQLQLLRNGLFNEDRNLFADTGASCRLPRDSPLTRINCSFK